jgi:Post-segregation antitoxin (ccd killing mechanism protein) encoded by the F plasmid
MSLLLDTQLVLCFLRNLVREEQERRWQEENADFIAAYNRTVETEGLPLEQWRTF